MFHLNKINIYVNDSKENLTTLGKKKTPLLQIKGFHKWNQDKCASEWVQMT